MIFDILFVKTFFLVGVMLIITSITTRINKDYETITEAVLTNLGLFGFLFLITFFSEVFPLNIILVIIFSAIVGWSLGPTITLFGKNFKFYRFLRNKNIKSKTDPDDKEKTIYYKVFSEEERKLKKEELELLKKKFKRDKSNQKSLLSTKKQWEVFIQENGIKHNLNTGIYFYEFIDKQIISNKKIEKLRNNFYESLKRSGDPYNKQWQDMVFQAMIGTALAVFCTASIVFLSNINFSFLGMFLFISLLILIIITLLNKLFFNSKKISLIKAYFGVVLFTLYLLYDFNRLEEMIANGDKSWSTAIDIAVNIYLDIINLFLDLLEILADS
ncbi:MAG: hypothetical protein CMD04_05495 [Flavobacteriales bacterium]|nr:hypothetical protein [Flavobacteriales bacterium]